MTITCRLCASLLAVTTIAAAMFVPTRPLDPPRPAVTTPVPAEVPAGAATWCPDADLIGDGVYEAWMVRRC